ncbi:MAG: PepSY-associated TM helix domain-containing protein [Pseudomonadota bacterium]
MKITEDFRKSMGWLHTWAGIAVSCFLFMVFWMGSLAVFDSEIDQWMKPELRAAPTEASASIDDIALPILQGEANESPRFFMTMPRHRRPFYSVGWVNGDGEFERVQINPQTGEKVTPTESFAGTSFFYPFHYSLHLPDGIGYWIVGFSSVAMLVLIVSGIFIHRKIIKDFFTFRPKKQLRRSTLDLHNLTSMIALPFHFIFPLTGLIIFFSIYLPWASAVPFQGDDQEKFAAMFGNAAVEASGDPAPEIASLQSYVDRAEAIWSVRNGEPAKVDLISIALANDANANITLRETFPSRAVSMSRNMTVFDAASGDIISDAPAGPGRKTHAWLSGLHFIQFNSWSLRWLYFIAGLSGCVMIASGLMFWMRARIRKGVIEPRSVRVVRGLSIGSISGIILSSGAYLVTNRIMPAQYEGYLGLDRAYSEVVIFYLVWIASFIHAAIRGKAAWREQAWAIAATALAAVALNWITTGDHPVTAAAQGLWQIASMDLVLIAGAFAAIYAARKLGAQQPETGTDKAAAGAAGAAEPAMADAAVPAE